MTCRECDQLDSFLANELDRIAAARFAAHLECCTACNKAIEQDRWIERLLRAPANTVGELPPATIAEWFNTSLVERSRRTRWMACGLAAAAGLVIAAGWTLKLNRQALHRAAPGPRSVVANSVRETRAPETTRATFVSGGDTIAVPIESPAADVTIVQLYPTVETERRWRRELALQNVDSEPNGG